MKKIILIISLTFIALLSILKIGINSAEYNVIQYSMATYLSSALSDGGGFDFEEWMDHTKKDVNGDGNIDALDLIEVKKILLEPIDPDSLVGDTNDNGKVDIRDLVYLKRYLSEN